MASVTVTSAASSTVRQMIDGEAPDDIWAKFAPVRCRSINGVKPLTLLDDVASISASELE